MCVLHIQVCLCMCACVTYSGMFVHVCVCYIFQCVCCSEVNSHVLSSITLIFKKKIYFMYVYVSLSVYMSAASMQVPAEARKGH